MKIIKNFIACITKKNNLKWVLVFLIVWWFFVSNTYAVWAESDTLDMAAWLLKLLMSFLSWAWIIPATLAGKLMTNDILYGSFLNLDASLWTLRNIIKNFANFALGFLVLYAIVKNVFFAFWGEDKAWSPLSVIRKTLIAGVLIQMSWFLMWALVDLSTIMTSAIWSFPSQLIASSSEMEWSIRGRLGKLKQWEIKFDVDDKEEPIKFIPTTGFVADEDWVTEFLDKVMPSHWSVWWPLIFLWLAVFDFNDFTNASNTWTATEWSDILLSLSLDAIVLIWFTVMMCLIFLFNLFRVLILWILIPLLPVIVLLEVFWFLEKLKWGWTWLDLKKLLDIKTIVMLVFKPVIMVWTLSLVLIVLVFIKTVIAWNDTWTINLSEDWNMQIVSQKVEWKGYTSTMKSEWIFEFSMDDTKNTIADIIVYFFGLFLVYLLVKFAVERETWIGFVDNAIEWTFGFVENMAKNLPVVPIGGWVWIKSMQDSFSTEKMLSNYTWFDASAQESTINKLLNIDPSGEFDKMLVDWVKKEVFISRAKAIATKNNIKHADMFANDSFEKKLKEWKEQNKNEDITLEDFTKS